MGGSLAPLGLSIAADKTTNLIFPYSIKSVDRGSKEILVQKAANVENVLQVKGAKRDFDDSNLTVITADGSLYSFLLTYADHPGILNLKLNRDDSADPVVEFSEYSDNEHRINGIADRIAKRKGTIKGKRQRKYDIALDLNGVYIDHDLLYFQVQLENDSYINYDIEQLRFFVRDRKQSKRTASQELEMRPLLVVGDIEKVRARSEQQVVFAFPKFTIPDKKKLVLQLLEKHGGRHLEVSIKYRTIAKALRPD